MIRDVGEIIKQCRHDAGLSQDQLCRVAGIGPRSTISQYERHGKCPSVYRFEDILNACGYELIIRKKGTKE
jgi:transcriptional regulator with XRE-family HTH domain